MALLTSGTLLCLGIACGLLSLIHLLTSRRWRLRKSGSLETPPTLADVPWWDIFGITVVMRLQQALDQERLLELIKEMQMKTQAAQGRRVTTISVNALGRRDFITTDPKNIQAVLAHQFNDYGLGSDRIGSMLPMLGVGIFVSDGKEWEHSRAMLRPNFTRNRVEDLSLEERHCQDLFAALPARTADGWTPEFDIQPFFFALTMDSATEFFFGESCYSLRATGQLHSPEARFVEAFDRGQYFLGKRTSMGSWYWLFDSWKFRSDCKIVHEWTDQCVARALERNRLRKQDSIHKEKYIFLDELIDQTQDPIRLRSQLLNVLIAGRDTTAGLLSWVFYHLSRRPDEYRKLRGAILDAFGTFEEPRNITFSSLKDCQPLQNLLKETLRLHPGVPFNIRQALTDSTLPRGGGKDGESPCFIPKHSQVFYSVHLMHRDRAIWGSNADEFIPDRWNGLRVGWEYLPFNGGPRICLGQMFSLTSAGYCVVRMLQQFDGLRTADLREPKIHISLTAKSANGVHISLHRAS